MKAEIQMLDNYVKSYEYKVNNRIDMAKELNIGGKMDYVQLDYKIEEDCIKAVIELEVNITLTPEGKTEECGNIKLVMDGLFELDKNIEKEKMEKLLAVNGAAILYQQMRAYIQVNSNLSGLPNIILPVINFVDVAKNKKENKN